MLANTAVDTWSLISVLPQPMFGGKASCTNLVGHVGALKDIEFEYNVAMTSKIPAGQGTM